MSLKSLPTFSLIVPHQLMREGERMFLGLVELVSLNFVFCLPINHHLIVGAGVSWKSTVRSFVTDNFFKDKKPPSNSTVRRIGLAPKKDANAAKYYRGAIRARPSTAINNNSLKEVHRNAHSCATNVSYCLEWAFEHPDLVQVFSLDDKGFIFFKIKNFIFHKYICSAKLNAGRNPALSRYVKSRKTYLEGQVPQFPDHDIRYEKDLSFINNYFLLYKQDKFYYFPERIPCTFIKKYI